MLLVLMLLPGGCGALKREENKEETEWIEGAMLKVGDLQIDYREGLVYLDATRREYERYYGTGIWDYKINDKGLLLGNAVKAEVLDSMVYLKIVCSKADEMNVCLTEDELREADKRADEYMKTLEGSRILEMGVNENVLRRIYSDNSLARKVFEQATLNVDTNIPNEYAKQHHFYSIAVGKKKVGVGGEILEFTEEEKAAAREQLGKLKEGWMEAKDLYSYAKTKTEDLTRLDMVIGRGDLDGSSLENALMGMRTGGFTDIIEDGDYYYVFYCMTEFDVDATQEKKEEIIRERQERAFENLYEKWHEETEVLINHAVWDKMEIPSL